MTDFSPRKRPQQERSRRTWRAIVDAAADLLVEEGYHNLTTDDIAEAADVSVGSVYQYFPNKEAVVLSVVQDFLDRQYEILTSGLDDVWDEDLGAAVRQLVENMIEAKRDQPELSEALLEQLPPIGQHDIRHELHDRSGALIRDALRERPEPLRPDDLELAARILITATHGIFQDAVTGRRELLDDDRLVDEVTDLMLRYLSGDGGSAGE